MYQDVDFLYAMSNKYFCQLLKVPPPKKNNNTAMGNECSKQHSQQEIDDVIFFFFFLNYNNTNKWFGYICPNPTQTKSSFMHVSTVGTSVWLIFPFSS